MEEYFASFRKSKWGKTMSSGKHQEVWFEQCEAARIIRSRCGLKVIDPAVVGTERVHVAVETRGDLTLGRTVMDFKHRNRLPPNCDVAMDADAALFNATLYKTFSRPVDTPLRQRGQSSNMGQFSVENPVLPGSALSGNQHQS
jgi:hypothetical protein